MSRDLGGGDVGNMQNSYNTSRKHNALPSPSAVLALLIQKPSRHLCRLAVAITVERERHHGTTRRSTR